MLMLMLANWNFIPQIYKCLLTLGGVFACLTNLSFHVSYANAHFWQGWIATILFALISITIVTAIYHKLNGGDQPSTTVEFTDHINKDFHS